MTLSLYLKQKASSESKRINVCVFRTSQPNNNGVQQCLAHLFIKYPLFQSAKLSHGWSDIKMTCYHYQILKYKSHFGFSTFDVLTPTSLPLLLENFSTKCLNLYLWPSGFFWCTCHTLTSSVSSTIFPSSDFFFTLLFLAFTKNKHSNLFFFQIWHDLATWDFRFSAHYIKYFYESFHFHFYLWFILYLLQNRICLSLSVTVYR